MSNNKIFKSLAALMILVSSMFFQSCRHNSCSDLNCQNGAPCINDYCNCQPGYEGPECRIMSKERFIGIWVGKSKCENYPLQNDTVWMYTKTNPEQVRMVTNLGNTSVWEMVGDAKTPELVFPTYENNDVWVNPYVRVDNNQMQMTIVTVNKRDSLRSVCEFEGRRVVGTDTMPTFTNP